jgi:hypothetical protein
MVCKHGKTIRVFTDSKGHARYRRKGQNGSNSHPKAGLSWTSLPIEDAVSGSKSEEGRKCSSDDEAESGGAQKHARSSPPWALRRALGRGFRRVLGKARGKRPP